MVKLVVTYSQGNEEYCSTEVVPLEYESAEAFYCHLEEAVLAAYKASEERHRHQEKWGADFRVLSARAANEERKLGRMTADTRRALDEHMAKSQPYPPMYVRVGGKVWEWAQFLARDRDHHLTGEFSPRSRRWMNGSSRSQDRTRSTTYDQKRCYVRDLRRGKPSRFLTH